MTISTIEKKMKLTPAKQGEPIRSLSLAGFNIDEDFSVFGKREKSFTLFGAPIIETFKRYVDREKLSHGDVIEVVAGKHSKGLVVVTPDLCLPQPNVEEEPAHQSLIIRLQNLLDSKGVPSGKHLCSKNDVFDVIDDAGLEVAKAALYEYDQNSRLRVMRSVSQALINHVILDVNGVRAAQ